MTETATLIVGTFEVTRDGQWVNTVEIDGMPLPIEPSRRVCTHSYGFNWGYYGSGPTQLALALLLTCTDRETAWRLSSSFKEEVVASWPYNASFTYPVADLQAWVESHRALLDDN